MLIDVQQLPDNSGTTCPICTKQILFERAMTGLSHDQPTKTSSLSFCIQIFILQKVESQRLEITTITYSMLIVAVCASYTIA